MVYEWRLCRDDPQVLSLVGIITSLCTPQAPWEFLGRDQARRHLLGTGTRSRLLVDNADAEAPGTVVAGVCLR